MISHRKVSYAIFFSGIFLMLMSLARYWNNMSFDILVPGIESPLQEETEPVQLKTPAENIQENNFQQKDINTEELQSIVLNRWNNIEREASRLLLKKDEILEGTSEETLHHPEIMLKETGHYLGLLKELWMSYPELKEKALSFYVHCSQDSNVLDSIRALCILNVGEINQNEKRTVLNEDSSIIPLVKWAESFSTRP